ncbi:MAG: HAD family hydrolase [Lachnospira sp.]
MSIMSKAVIFDLDGTILDTLEDLRDSLNYALSEHNMPTRSLEQVRHFVGNGIYKLVERGVEANSSYEMINNVFNTFCSYYPAHCHIKTKPYDHIPEFLTRLKTEGFILGVLSNKADNAVNILCDKYFPYTFTFSRGAREGIAKKPAPDALYEIENEYKLAAKDIIYVGDSEVDIKTAKNAGINSIIVDWGFRTRAELSEFNPQIIVSSIDELYEKIHLYFSENK